MNKTPALNFIRGLLFRNRFAETILALLTRGRTMNSLISRVPANHYQYPPGSYRTCRRDGIYYRLDISDYMEWLVYFGITSEANRRLYAIARNQKIIFDVGANIGDTTLHFAHLAGPSSTIHSFEPWSVCYEILTANILRNDFKNIVANNIGLGDKAERTFLSPEVEDNKGGARISNKSAPNISVITLDQYVTDMNIQHIGLIKIDVEGYEMKVLKGAERSIQQWKPVLFIELNDKNLRQQNSSAAELVSFLEKYYGKITDAETGKLVSSAAAPLIHTDIIAEN